MADLPGPWAFAVLALGSFRLLRLLAWDDLPPIVRARAWLLGESWVVESDEEARPEYRRPLLAHLFGCAFCLGWWTSLGCYLAWLAAPRLALIALAPFALSGAVGLVAKNLDP